MLNIVFLKLWWSLLILDQIFHVLLLLFIYLLYQNCMNLIHLWHLLYEQTHKVELIRKD